MTLPRCYLATPFGFTESGRAYYRSTFLPALATVVEPLDPWTDSRMTGAAAARRERRLPGYWLDIARENLDWIATSDLLVAVLDGQEPDCGTTVELGYAAALGIPCYGLRSDLRQAGEEGVELNLQVAGTITASGGCLLRSLDELVATLSSHVTKPRPGRRLPATQR